MTPRNSVAGFGFDVNKNPLSTRNLVVAAALLSLMGVLAWGAVLRESVTIDEVAHVGAGVSYLSGWTCA